MVLLRCSFLSLMQITAFSFSEPDPCVLNKPLYKIGSRGIRCPVSSDGSCDRLLDGGWYNVSYRGVPINMPTTCVNSGFCGTTFPIWMNGRLPEVSAGIVHREACVRGLDTVDCCIRRYNISIKNCGSYNVYKLPYTEACDEVYCFGDHDCDSLVIESTSSVVQTPSATMLTTSSESSSQNDKDMALSHCPSREYRTDVTAMVAGCLCSAIIGGLVTFLMMYRWDSIHRGRVIFDNPKKNMEDNSPYNIFKAKDLNVVGHVQSPAIVFPPGKVTTNEDVIQTNPYSDEQQEEEEDKTSKDPCIEPQVLLSSRDNETINETPQKEEKKKMKASSKNDSKGKRKAGVLIDVLIDQEKKKSERHKEK